MPATIAGTPGCSFALSGNAAGLSATTRVSFTLKRDKKELRGYAGGVKAVAYYNPTTDISIEGYGTVSSQIGGSVQVSGAPSGIGTSIIVEEITYDQSNDDFVKSSIKAIGYTFAD